MKKFFLSIIILFVTLSCKNSDKEFKNLNNLENKHPLEMPFDSLANILNDNKYFKKKILKIIEEFGPMSFRKENQNWFIYRYDNFFTHKGTRFKLFRVPLDSIYNNNYSKKEISEKYFRDNLFRDINNIYLIDYTSSLRNVLSAEGVGYNSKNKEYSGYVLKNEINIKDFGFKINNDNDYIEHVEGNAIIFNTTSTNVKNIKLKISVFDNFINGKLITEDIFLVNDSLKINELKIININYKPKNKFKSEGLTPLNIEILNYEKF